MNLLLRDFAGDSVYLDTMLPYALLRGFDEQVRLFFERVEAGAIQAYTSVLTFDELAYRLILALVRERYGGSPLDVLREQEVTVLREIVPPVRAALEELTRLPNLYVVEVVADDLSVMTDSMERYQLRPRDALHYAVMVRLGCLNIASRDAHFDRIPGLTRYVP
ncbi:MAG: type II toxin-antitoxin system VapC family toxin [Firmicutes bacterium]|nr:type II toxin-antitoxin system VapC family toxin [Bacillota bacterium]